MNESKEKDKLVLVVCPSQRIITRCYQQEKQKRMILSIPNNS